MIKNRLDVLQGEFLDKVRGFVKDWADRDVPVEAKIDGVSKAYLELLDNKYILAPIDDESEVQTAISGSLLGKYLGEVPVEDEAEIEFIEHVKDMGRYWGEVEGDYKDRYRLNGFMFSMLVALDGDSSIPQHFIARKTNVKIDLAGSLHELYHENK